MWELNTDTLGNNGFAYLSVEPSSKEPPQRQQAVPQANSPAVAVSDSKTCFNPPLPEALLPES